MTTTTTIPAGAAQGTNPLRGLLAYGQSPWLDFIRRSILLNGDLEKMINEDGLRGMTSNPAIFEKAIVAGDDYNDIVKAPDAKSSTAMALYEKIAIRDVQDACDIFKAVHAETKGRDGYVSLEVSPMLAYD
ncbi:MAG TPA: transaldolase family protein, partial [Candidatus Acidoferrum sp.]|nr:transaldolase family protein [Candidatus Acidoferrum sp.]